MIHEVRLPQVELSMESVTVLNWLVGEGDCVEVEQPILEVETQKATIEVPSLVAGYVRKLFVQKNDEIGENALLCFVTDTVNEPIKDPAGRAVEPVTTSNGVSVVPSTIRSTVPKADHGPVLAAPAARKRARELGLDLATVKGTGPGGRITLEDVQSTTSLNETLGSSQQEIGKK